MAKPSGGKPEKPAKPEKTQDELRAILEQKLKSLKPAIDDGIKEYEQALKDGIFDDVQGETAGSGEARKEALQKKLNGIFTRAEKMKAKLDSKETLKQTEPDICPTYTHPDGKQETITLNIEAKLAEFTSFYQKTSIDLPPDFEEAIRDIWETNLSEIEQAIEQNGFDDMLLIPPTTNLPDLVEKMKMGNGYYTGSNFDAGGGFAGAVSQNTDKPRIILYHKMDSLPEISQKTGLDIHLNITGADAQALYQTNPNDFISTLEDAIILERKYFEETDKHLSDYTKNSAQWLPGTKSGTRLVRSYWYPGDDGLCVGACDLGYQGGYLGVRPSRCFF